jgi:plasmid maintenance system antidote protein VapI
MQSKQPNMLGERLIELQIERAKLASILGVNPRTVYKWLAYETQPRLTVDQFVKLCEVLRWSPVELATAYNLNRPTAKNSLGAVDAPKQTSLLT